MAVILTTSWPGLTPDDYERLRQELMREGSLPEALRLQIAAVQGTQLYVTEVWESARAADEFRSGRLARAVRRAGIDPPGPPEVMEVHRILGPAGRPTARASRRVLVVANKTLGSRALEAELRRQAEAGPCVFHLLVPAAPPGVADLPGEANLEDPFLQDQLMQASLEQARQLLDEHLEALRRSGIDATGEVGLADPATAVRFVVGRRRFDEVILSTLPSGLSRWLGMDLPSRLRRMLEVPLTVVTAEATD
ncbi:MAG TPA: hypothetical protein VE990_04005 [Acidimicrobiales bacterium]|nr:hypothetical protein [Acidimicrobiales bacterium]